MAIAASHKDSVEIILQCTVTYDRRNWDLLDLRLQADLVFLSVKTVGKICKKICKAIVIQINNASRTVTIFETKATVYMKETPQGLPPSRTPWYPKTYYGWSRGEINNQQTRWN